jgi:hypothetical protein
MIITTLVCPNPKSNQNFNSDPSKSFGFFRIRIRNTGIEWEENVPQNLIFYFDFRFERLASSDKMAKAEWQLTMARLSFQPVDFILLLL